MIKRSVIFVAAALMFGVFVASDASAQRRDKWMAPRIGVWQVEGKDAENTLWSATLKITGRRNVNNSVRLRGYFKWTSADGETAGRENVNGRFDRSTGRLTLQGHSVKSERGEIMKTGYVAFVSKKGRVIDRGRWFGRDVVKGKWAANWSEPEPK